MKLLSEKRYGKDNIIIQKYSHYRKKIFYAYFKHLSDTWLRGKGDSEQEAAQNLLLNFNDWLDYEKE